MGALRGREPGCEQGRVPLAEGPLVARKQVTVPNGQLVETEMHEADQSYWRIRVWPILTYGVLLSFLAFQVLYVCIGADNTHTVWRIVLALSIFVALCLLGWAFVFREIFGIRITPEGLSLRSLLRWRHYPLDTILKVRIGNRSLAGTKKNWPEVYIHIVEQQKPIQVAEGSFVCERGEIVDRLRACFGQILEEDA